MNDIEHIQKTIGKLFRESFGRTSLQGRLDDILNEALELLRFRDIENLREETGDLLCSILALCEECGFDAERCIEATASKIQRRKNQYHSLGRKMKVALLGGAFDPPTLGHLAVAKFVLDTSRTFDEVWLVPCYHHMYNKEMAPFPHRLTMCEKLVAKDKRIKTFDFEYRHRLKGETFHFVQKLLEEPFAQNEYDFSLIIGMDNANTFDRWVNYAELERAIRFVVVPRSGQERNHKVNWYLKPPHIFLQPDSPLPDTSSTEVRRILANSSNSDELDGLISTEVLSYIRTEKLYV